MSTPTDQREFSRIRVGDVFTQDGVSYKKICERTAASFHVHDDGSFDFDPAVPFFAEEVVELEKDAGNSLDKSGITIQEFGFLVQVAQTREQHRLSIIQASMQRTDRDHMSDCGRDVLDMLTGNACNGNAASSWFDVIVAYANRPVTQLS